MRYTTVTQISPTDYSKKYLNGKNIHIPSIRETYIDAEKFLTTEGKLYIEIEKNKKYYLFNLFEEFSNKDFNAENGTILSDIHSDTCGAETTTPVYEATHRLVLTKDASNKYYAELMYIGCIDVNKYYYMLDTDFILINQVPMNISDDGYFVSDHLLSDLKIYDLAIAFNKFMYINIHANENSNTKNIKYMVNGTYLDKTVSNNYYFIPNTNDKPYNILNIIGTATSPKQIILEVY